MDGWVVGGKLSSQAIKGIREKVQIATKFALGIDKDGNRVVRGDPEYVRAACEASLKRLDVEQIDLYYQHRVDTKVPIEITVRDACSSLECTLWVGTSVVAAHEVSWIELFFSKCNQDPPMAMSSITNVYNNHDSWRTTSFNLMQKKMFLAM